MATPKKFSGMSLRVDAKFHETLMRAAKERGVSAGQILREAAAAALDVCPTCGQDHPRARKPQKATVAA